MTNWKMPKEEFIKQRAELLAGLPVAFREFVSSHTNANTLSFSYEETLMIVREMVDDLLPCIAEFGRICQRSVTDINAARNALGSTDRGENGLYGPIGE